MPPSKRSTQRDSRDWEKAGERALTKLLDRISELVPEIGPVDFKLLTEATKVVGEVTGTAIALRSPGGEGDGGGKDDGDDE